jgi:hemin uptake protein HemP
VKERRGIEEDAAAPLPLSGAARSASASRRLSTAALFRGGNEILIEHRGQEYRLRITKADKLILTK